MMIYSKDPRFLRAVFSRVSVITLIALSCAVSVAHGATLSTYRIYLDEQNRVASFVVFNKTSVPEECSLGLRHNDFDEKGNMFRVEDGVVPENSAKPWIRYSPQKFEIPAGIAQTVRFTMRRKANAQEGEYRSYLLIDCNALEGSDGKPPSVSLAPKLVHNVPIIVRNGALNVTLGFENIEIEDEQVSFDLVRKGARSTYGELQLFDKAAEEVASFRRNISIYPEFERAHYELNFNGADVSKLELRFIEDDRYGGTEEIKKQLIAN